MAPVILRGARSLVPRLSNDWFRAMQRGVSDLDRRISALPEAELSEAESLPYALREVVTQAEAKVASNEALYGDLVTLGERTEGFGHTMEETIRLEQRMAGIMEHASSLVQRLTVPTKQPGG